MPEFQPDKESESRAKKLSSRLMSDVLKFSEAPSDVRREAFSDQQYSDYAEDVPISDVMTNVGQMESEFALARRWDHQIACLKLDSGDLAPISVTEFAGGPIGPTYGPDEWIEFWERYAPVVPTWRDLLRRSIHEENVVVTDIREAVDAVERNLTSFLAYRFAGISRWREWIEGIGGRLFGGSKGPSRDGRTGSGSPPPPPAVGPGGGLQVQVSCLTPGLRIHVSPAYFITWLFFGSPSTPVTSYMLPGRYVFAGDGPMLPRRTRDHAVFCIPPDYRPALTRF
jgi:hypothetical protein